MRTLQQGIVQLERENACLTADQEANVNKLNLHSSARQFMSEQIECLQGLLNDINHTAAHGMAVASAQFRPVWGVLEIGLTTSRHAP